MEFDPTFFAEWKLQRHKLRICWWIFIWKFCFLQALWSGNWVVIVCLRVMYCLSQKEEKEKTKKRNLILVTSNLVNALSKDLFSYVRLSYLWFFFVIYSLSINNSIENLAVAITIVYSRVNSGLLMETFSDGDLNFKFCLTKRKREENDRIWAFKLYYILVSERSLTSLTPNLVRTLRNSLSSYLIQDLVVYGLQLLIWE